MPELIKGRHTPQVRGMTHVLIRKACLVAGQWRNVGDVIELTPLVRSIMPVVPQLDAVQADKLVSLGYAEPHNPIETATARHHGKEQAVAPRQAKAAV
jgi:hypothetical protein